jgi:hypothetical protein
MKRIIYLALLFATALNAQERMSEKEAINEKYIDFKKQYLFFEITGKIEIDGHIFDNKKRDCPIIYTADIRGIEIVDTCLNVKYEYRECNEKNCDIIHLVIKQEIKLFDTYPDLQLFNNGTMPIFNEDLFMNSEF